MKQHRGAQAGFTLVELTVSVVVIGVIAVGIFSLFNALIQSIILAKRQSVALTLATNQIEYLKSLPYDNLAVQGGAIYATTLLPAQKVEKVNGVTYRTTTSIGYVDDAFDGCANYPTQQDKERYCRNYPPPASAPGTDTNAADYKGITVATQDSSGTKLASVDTQITARVAESASTTGALFITVIDSSGAPVTGASVGVTNSTIAPAVAINDSSDANGVSVFYNLPADSGNDYVITVSKAGYSSLNTIAASGTLQPTYSNQKVLAQQSSSVSIVLEPMMANSLAIEAVNTNGTPVPNLRLYLKGGYKKYTATDNTEYYYDTLAPADTRVITDAGGLAAQNSLAPIGGYYFCGDEGDTGCQAGAIRYYLAAALPYGGTSTLSPIVVPPYSVSTPPGSLYQQGGVDYIQKVRLIVTTNANFPRIFSLSRDEISLSAPDLSAATATIMGKNLSGATASLRQGATTYSGTGCAYGTTTSPAHDSLTCTFDLRGASIGDLELVVGNPSGTLSLPGSPRGGMHVVP